MRATWETGTWFEETAVCPQLLLFTLCWSRCLLLGLALGFAMPLLGLPAWQDRVWAGFTTPVLIVLLYEIASSLRRGEVGLDIVAALSMGAALVVGEELAAAVVALMYSGGQFLEAFAERHARREMTALLARVPRTAVRHRDGNLEEVALEMIVPGDCLLIRQGDVVPADGVVASGLAVLDQSALTGEVDSGSATQGPGGHEWIDERGRSIRSRCVPPSR